MACACSAVSTVGVVEGGDRRGGGGDVAINMDPGGARQVSKKTYLGWNASGCTSHLEVTPQAVTPPCIFFLSYIVIVLSYGLLVIRVDRGLSPPDNLLTFSLLSLLTHFTPDSDCSPRVASAVDFSPDSDSSFPVAWTTIPYVSDCGLHASLFKGERYLYLDFV